MMNPDAWYRFALQQMAAESILDRRDEIGLRQVLFEGNTDTRRSEGGQPTGYTRMPAAQSAEFIANYEIAAHRANDATGMSATLIRSRADGSYTLSVRSTEFKDYDKGGDYERDNLGANRSILAYGFAHAQVAALEDFFAQTVAPIVGTERIYVTPLPRNRTLRQLTEYAKVTPFSN